MVARHNKFSDVFVECCRQANVSAQVEVGRGFGHDNRSTRPADVLVPNWSLGKPAAFDLTITSCDVYINCWSILLSTARNHDER